MDMVGGVGGIDNVHFSVYGITNSVVSFRRIEDGDGGVFYISYTIAGVGGVDDCDVGVGITETDMIETVRVVSKTADGNGGVYYKTNTVHAIDWIDYGDGGVMGEPDSVGGIFRVDNGDGSLFREVDHVAVDT